MENTSNSIYQKYKQSLRFEIDNSIHKETFYNYLKDFCNGKNTIHIQKTNNVISLTYSESTIKVPQNISLNNILRSSLMLINKSNRQKKKKIHSFKKLITDYKEWSNQYVLISDIYNAFSISDSLEDFCKLILKIKQFKQFTSFHLISHEKGKLRSLHQEFGRQIIRASEIPIKNYTDLFNSVKKSKNRSYGEKEIKGDVFNILGTFLAHEFSYKHYSFIILLSRNDFLPQAPEEKDSFKILIHFIPLFIHFYLKQDYKKNNQDFFKNIISNSIFPIRKKDSYTEYEANTKEIEIDNKIFEVNLSPQKLINQTELHHKERVSLLGDLLNTLKHELSNPLFGLQLSSELLLLENLEEDQITFLREININTKRCQKIINNFQALFNDKTTFEECNLLSILEEVFTLTKSESKRIKKIYTFNLSKYDKDNLKISTNQTWLAQIFFNLILNTTQACESIKSPTLNITFCDDKSKITIDFIDNGPGIDQNQMQNIFDSFFTTKNSGTGLGLSISKSLAKKLGGNLFVLPHKNGAHFRLELKT
ncbi:MAG: HAMP domain-containing histidine kinase [Bacteriovoracaceae bacterium]|jgi:signal transduction histidine kinase|nr:HAMP domain-containing histidine kinase [Bacteriovoracaceae bacterium]